MDVKLTLMETSWENIFEVIRHRDTKLKSEGNFWAAILYLERQFEEAKKLKTEE